MDLVLVHESLPFDGVQDVEWDAKQSNDEHEYLDGVAAEVASGSSVPLTHAVLRGEAVDMICARIGEIHADLAVMTSHGRTGLSRAWLGSVADGVLRHSTIPVLLLRPIEGKARRDAAHHLFKRILVLADGSAMATEVFAAAEALAKCGNAPISLLRVVQPVPSVMSDPIVASAYVAMAVDDEATKRVADQAKDQLAETARRWHEASGVDVEPAVVVEPRVAPAVLEFARTHDIDAIAMSTHGRGLSRFLLGSVADKVLRGSGLPMLLYRPLEVQARVHGVEAVATALG